MYNICLGILASSHKANAMNSIENILRFPFRDREASGQFLIACAVMLAAFIIPLLPQILLMGYCFKIMRQIIMESRSPSMPAWQGSDWGEMFMDGLRLWGAQVILMLPLFLLIGCGLIFLIGGTAGISALADQGLRNLRPVAGILLFLGMFSMILFTLLSVPYGVVLAAAQGHVAAKRSFLAAFEFKEWWPIFRAAVGPFLIAYVGILVASFVFVFITQVAMITIVLICIVPFLMVPFSVYLMLVSNALYARAYATGQKSLQNTWQPLTK